MMFALRTLRQPVHVVMIYCFPSLAFHSMYLTCSCVRSVRFALVLIRLSIVWLCESFCWIALLSLSMLAYFSWSSNSVLVLRVAIVYGRAYGRLVEVWLTCNARHVLVVDPFISMRGYETTHSLYQFFTTKQHKTKEMERNKNEWRWWKKISSIIHYKFKWE